MDNYKEHKFHDKYDEQCSECYKENRLLQAKKTVDDPFSFENVMKLVGQINKTNYGINPYE